MPDHFRRGPGVLLEEDVEIGRMLEAQAVCDLRDAVIGVGQQRAGFVGDARRNDLGGAPAGHFLHGAVQMVHVNGQPVGKIVRRFQLQGLLGGIHGELPLQKLDELRRDARRSIDVFFGGQVVGLHLVRLVKDQVNIMRNGIVFLHIIAFHFLHHFFEDEKQVVGLCFGQRKDRVQAGIEERRIPEIIIGHRGRNKMIVEEAEITALLFRHGFPQVRYRWIVKYESAAFHFYFAVFEVQDAGADHQGDLVEIGAVDLRDALAETGPLEHVEVAHLRRQDTFVSHLGRKIFLVIFLKRDRFAHAAILFISNNKSNTNKLLRTEAVA